MHLGGGVEQVDDFGVHGDVVGELVGGNGEKQS